MGFDSKKADSITRQQGYMLIGIVLVAIVLFHFLRLMLAPFVISMVLAYLGDSLVDRFELWGVSRGSSVAMVFLAIFSILVAASLVLIPLLVQQVKTMFQLLPVWEAWGRSNIMPFLQERFDIDPSMFDLGDLFRNVAGQWQKAGGLLASLGVSVSKSSVAFIEFAVNFFLVPIVTFYLLRDWDKLMGNIKAMVPRNMESVVSTMALECDEVLGAFLKGQLMVMLALGMLYSVGLTLVGLQFAILIGMMAGLVSIIPYMGFAVGFTVAIMVALFQFDNYTDLTLVAVVFVVVQMLESWILTPMLVGDRIGLHPVAVIFSLMAGGQLFGFVGMLVALPVAAIIMVLLRYVDHNYKASELYNAGE